MENTLKQLTNIEHLRYIYLIDEGVDFPQLAEGLGLTILNTIKFMTTDEGFSWFNEVKTNYKHTQI
jgi:hypothetical protein